jgi:hypothetical protein
MIDCIDMLLAFCSRNLPLIVMFYVAIVMRRSLGAWPVFLSALLTGALVQVGLALQSSSAPLPVTLLDTMLAPSLLFGLARRQIVPGLRRGQMSDKERARWLTRTAFAPTARSSLRRLS